jgi:hypothetical protein
MRAAHARTRSMRAALHARTRGAALHARTRGCMRAGRCMRIRTVLPQSPWDVANVRWR